MVYVHEFNRLNWCCFRFRMVHFVHPKPELGKSKIPHVFPSTRALTSIGSKNPNRPVIVSGKAIYTEIWMDLGCLIITVLCVCIYIIYPPTPLLWLRGRRKGSVKHWLPCLLAISPTWQASSHVPIPIFVCSGFESRKPLRCVRARPSIRHVPTCWGSAVLPLAVRATKAYRWAVSPTPHACFASNHVPNQCLPKLRAAPIHLCF